MGSEPMSQLDFPLLSVLLILPVAGAVLGALLPRRQEGWLKATAMATTIIVFVLSLALYFNFQTGAPGCQFG